MNDRKWIYAGLGVFLALVLFPAWYDALEPAAAGAPELEYPADETACVESTEFMRANHPVLLNEWRNAAIRDGETEYVATNGEHYTISLTGTCMQCHDNRDTFCVRCHDYADVSPTCWDCHVEP
jgi:hypothetical protein